MTTHHYDQFQIHGGYLLVAASSKGICLIHFGTSAKTLLKEAKEKLGTALEHSPAKLKEARTAIERYLSGDSKALLTLALDLRRGTALQRKVWHILQTIPYGQTLSYSEVARKAGKPRAVRAVGSACGANPLPLVVPCHRVLAKNGSLGGFGWGLPMKRWLLALESSQRQSRKAA